MTRQTVTEGDLIYTIALDDDRMLGSRMNALTRARIIDELTGNPIESGVSVTPLGTSFQRLAARQNVWSRVAAGGLAGLTGVPTTVLPGLASQAYEVGMLIRAEGYIPTRIVQPLGPQVNFPTTFAPAMLGDVALHRTPIILKGRTVRRTASGTVPVPNVTVRITGIWRTLPTASVVAPASPPNLVSVFPPLYAARTSVTGVVRTVTMTPTVGDDKQLVDPVMAGAHTVRLSNRANIAVGDVLVFDELDLERREHLVITAVEGASSPDQSATVTVAHPLACSHPRGTIVRKTAVSSPGPTRALSTDAIVGDRTLLCTSVAGFGTPTIVEISGGASEKEYHLLRPYSVTSDANGDYQLPPLSRVAQVSVEAQHAPDPSVSQIVGPAYPAYEQYVNFTFV